MVFTMTVLGTLLLVIAGRLAYHVRFEGNIFSIVGGFILAGSMHTARTAQVVAMVLM